MSLSSTPSYLLVSQSIGRNFLTKRNLKRKNAHGESRTVLENAIHAKGTVINLYVAIGAIYSDFERG